MNLLFDSSNRKRVSECPCGKSNADGKFVPLKGETKFGYCHSCGETFTDRENAKREPMPTYGRTQQPTVPTYYFSAETVQRTLSNYDKNAFVLYLDETFGTDTAIDLCEKYQIGTSKHWNGATIFWYVDIQGRYHTGKVMQYDASGHRVKEINGEKVNRINWAHKLHPAVKKLTESSEARIDTCLFFGEHLLTDDSKPIAIVESEKTAIIASVYLPKFVWIASGGASGLKNRKENGVLKGREITLYPDLNKFDEWMKLASDLSEIASVTVSDYLESNVSDADRKAGYDIADFLLQFPLENQEETAINEPQAAIFTQRTELHTPQNEAVSAWIYPNPDDVPILDMEAMERAELRPEELARFKLLAVFFDEQIPKLAEKRDKKSRTELKHYTDQKPFIHRVIENNQYLRI